MDEAQEAEALQPEIYRTLERRMETEDIQDVDEVTRRLKERYGQREYADVGEYLGDADRIPMQFLLPTPKDAHLWLVKCKVRYQ